MSPLMSPIEGTNPPLAQCVNGLGKTLKRETTKCKFSVSKVTIEEMECKFGCHEKGRSSTVILQTNIGLKLKQNQTAKSKV